MEKQKINNFYRYYINYYCCLSCVTLFCSAFCVMCFNFLDDQMMINDQT